MVQTRQAVHDCSYVQPPPSEELMLDRSLYTFREFGPSFDEAQYARAVADVFPLLRPLMASDETGGVLVTKINSSQHATMVGSFMKYPAKSCFRIAAEKVRRLETRQRRQGHVSAWQSCNPMRHRYAGCFLLSNGMTVSFSGLTAEWDEGLLLAPAWLCRLSSLDDVARFQAINGNQLITTALDVVRGAVLSTWDE